MGLRSWSNGAASLLLVVAALILAAPALAGTTGRWRLVPILSGSMAPSFATGSLVVATPVSLDRLRVGDVVLYRIPLRDHHLIAHRIVRLVRGGRSPVVETKGDANTARDPWRARLHGARAWVVRSHIPYVGYASVYARWLGPLLLTLALVSVAVVCALRLIWRHPSDRPRRSGARRALLRA